MNPDIGKPKGTTLEMNGRAPSTPKRKNEFRNVFNWEKSSQNKKFKHNSSEKLGQRGGQGSTALGDFNYTTSLEKEENVLDATVTLTVVGGETD